MKMGVFLIKKQELEFYLMFFFIGNPHIVLGINDKWRFRNKIQGAAAI